MTNKKFFVIIKTPLNKEVGNTKIGDKVKLLRKRNGLTQTELGEKLGVKTNAVSKWECGRVEDIPMSKVKAMAALFDVPPSFLIDDDQLPSNAIPYASTHKAPIIGSIPAGYPVLAIEDIEGYADIPYSDEENYFFLRVNGESMKNSGIHTGDLVLIRRQKYADDGQVVAARVNGDEATLKRYKRQKDNVLLLPENPDFDPRIVPAKDFETGDAQIIGVALEVRHTL